MATRETLEPREADASGVEEILALAREAMEDPADNEYARELLDKAELACQMPLEYIAVAEMAVAVDDKEYSDDLYEQAEDACFEAGELAALGHSLAAVRDDKEKAKEILERAADEAKGIADFLTIGGYVQADLGDEELAKELLGKVEESCKSFEDYKKLAATVMTEMNDRETAEAFYRKGEAKCDGADEMIVFAEGILEVFEDKDWAVETLEEVEGDAQFTKEFVALAGAHQKLFDDAEKVGEMMQQAADYAMSGEENLDLAEGYWNLLKDGDAAAEAYRKALGDLDDKAKLLELAKKVGTEMENADLAKEIYAKVEGKLTGAADAGKLAHAVCEDLGDRGLAGEIYDRAEKKFAEPADALVLAGCVLKDLEDKDWAGRLYGRAIEGTTEFGPLLKLNETVQKDVGDADLSRTILEKAAGVANGPPEYLQVVDQIMAILEDREMATGLVDSAEESVTSLDELKKVDEAVGKYFADDAERVARVKEKLEKREANQGLYTELQKVEDGLVRFHETVKLADRVMDELEDRFYAAKLLRKAEEFLTAQAFSGTDYLSLVTAVERHLDDKDWMGALTDAALARASGFTPKREICRAAAVRISDKDFAAGKIRACLEDAEKALDSGSAYDMAKLASAVREDLGDDAWAGKLLAAAEAAASGPFALAHVADANASLGDDAKAGALREQAVKACGSVEECGRLIGRFMTARLEDAKVRDLYRAYGAGLSEPEAKLRWAEGILNFWRDEDWAKTEFRGIEGAMGAGAGKARFDASVQFHFDGEL